MSDAKKKNIVIVDDEDDIRSLLKEAFSKNGYNVYLAENGLRLVAILRSQDVNAVLLDINMPWLSGFQLCKSIKNDSKLKHIKVIYLSGHIRDEKECFDTGCDDIIKKPFKVSEVIEKVEKLISS
jgi:DNA-binding response OmpR family regulator